MIRRSKKKQTYSADCDFLDEFLEDAPLEHSNSGHSVNDRISTFPKEAGTLSIVPPHSEVPKVIRILNKQFDHWTPLSLSW